jgi:AcrR family transcriptional regulator
MNRLAPGELTLAAIAAEAGVTAGALVQRFGSKRELMLALAAGAASSTGALIDQLRRVHRSPLAALRAYGDCLAQMASSPAALARSLAYLEIDLADDDFRQHLLVQARATRAGIAALLAEARRTGELAKDTDLRRLGRAVEAVLNGSLLTWAIHQEGTAAAWIRGDLDAVLAPYR